MNILILCGSPHREGTSNTLVKEFIRGAEDAGHKTTVYDCAHGNIHPCLGCDCCDRNGDEEKQQRNDGTVDFYTHPVSKTFRRETVTTLKEMKNITACQKGSAGRMRRCFCVKI